MSAPTKAPAFVACCLLPVACCLFVFSAASAFADPLPYKIWWSFPNDDETAIEVDSADLDESKWDRDRWKFAVAMQKCDFKKSKLLAQHKDETPVREIRVDSLEPDGKVRATTRCVMTLKDWRTRIGKDLVYRLDDELDAHAAFLMPRRMPGMPAKTTIGPGGVSRPNEEAEDEGERAMHRAEEKAAAEKAAKKAGVKPSGEKKQGGDAPQKQGGDDGSK
jgi:hypothetical protein